MGIGASELLLILVIVLVVFGATRVPQVGTALGQAIRKFKRAVSGGSSDSDDERKNDS